MIRPWIAALMLTLPACAPRTRGDVDTNDLPVPAPPHAPGKRASASKTIRGWLGIVVSPETVDITSQLEGRLEAISVRPGDHVLRDQVIARIDTRSARHEHAIAAAELVSARTEFDRAKLELAQAIEQLERREQVIRLSTETVSTVSKEEQQASRYKRQFADIHVSEAQASVTAKEARLAELARLVAEGTLRAPFDGTISMRYADAGTVIRKGTPILRLIERGTRKLRFAVPEGQAANLEPSARVRVGLAGTEIAATVEKIAPEVETASGLILAEAAFDSQLSGTSDIRPGTVARVWLETAAPTRAAQ